MPPILSPTPADPAATGADRHSLRSMGAYLRPLSSCYRKRVRKRYLALGGPYGKGSPFAQPERTILRDAVAQVLCEVETAHANAGRLSPDMPLIVQQLLVIQNLLEQHLLPASEWRGPAWRDVPLLTIHDVPTKGHHD